MNKRKPRQTILFFLKKKLYTSRLNSFILLFTQTQTFTKQTSNQYWKSTRWRTHGRHWSHLAYKEEAVAGGGFPQPAFLARPWLRLLGEGILKRQLKGCSNMISHLFWQFSPHLSSHFLWLFFQWYSHFLIIFDPPPLKCKIIFERPLIGI